MMKVKYTREDMVLNVRHLKDRWFDVNETEFDEEEMFRYKDFYEIYDPTKLYYTPDEIKYNLTVVYRNFGQGLLPYFYDLVYIRIISKDKRVERRLYIVANQILYWRELPRYVKFCQCSECIYYNRFERWLHRINPFHKQSNNEPCLF